MESIPKTIRLPPELIKQITDFCEKSHRHEAHTIRAILQIFFAEGDDTAERRLCRDLWDAKPARYNRNRTPKEVSP